jgi:hypothetical protein
MGGGILINTNEAAATLTVGTDAFRNERKSVSSRNRVVSGIAIVGGNAINEASVDLYAGDHFFGTFRNSLNGAVSPIMPDHFQSISPTVVAAGDRITAIVATAPTVSPLLIQLFGQEL